MIVIWVATVRKTEQSKSSRWKNENRTAFNIRKAAENFLSHQGSTYFRHFNFDLSRFWRFHDPIFLNVDSDLKRLKNETHFWFFAVNFSRHVNGRFFLLVIFCQTPNLGSQNLREFIVKIVIVGHQVSAISARSAIFHRFYCSISNKIVFFSLFFTIF